MVKCSKQDQRRRLALILTSWQIHTYLLRLISQKAVLEGKQRRNFGERPMYGTVTDILSGGESGLISGGQEEMAEATANRGREWEKALTYGKRKE